MTSDRASTWSVTINNPTKEDDEAIAIVRQRGWKVEGQLEKGAQGTQHYQLLLRTPQVRFSAIKKQFPRAHIEPARNAQALANYVSKEETRVGSLPTSQEKYPSLAKFWDLINDELAQELGGPTDEELISRSLSDKRLLELFDQACYNLIWRGYHIETMAVNPQIRCSFTKFAPAILHRSYADRQTDRQDPALEQNVEVPTVVT